MKNFDLIKQVKFIRNHIDKNAVYVPKLLHALLSDIMLTVESDLWK